MGKTAPLTLGERVCAFNKKMMEGSWVSKDLPDIAERFDTRWLADNYEAGDIMLLGRLRLSTDIRYQNVEDEIDARWSNHWTLGDML